MTELKREVTEDLHPSNQAIKRTSHSNLHFNLEIVYIQINLKVMLLGLPTVVIEFDEIYKSANGSDFLLSSNLHLHLQKAAIFKDCKDVIVRRDKKDEVNVGRKLS